MEPSPSRPPKPSSTFPAKIATYLGVGLLAIGCSACLASDEEEASRIAEILAVRAGESVADVGAGDGEWSQDLAARVGPGGRVWATEVEQDMVDELVELFESAGLPQARAVLGDQDRTGLPPACCDAVLLRMVYHHFQDPAAMRADLRRALRPGGRLLIVDITPQESWSDLEGVPDRGGHGIPRAALLHELTGDGFELLSTFDDWNGEADRFAALFRVLPAPAARP